MYEKFQKIQTETSKTLMHKMHQKNKLMSHFFPHINRRRPKSQTHRPMLCKHFQQKQTRPLPSLWSNNLRIKGQKYKTLIKSTFRNNPIDWLIQLKNSVGRYLFALKLQAFPMLHVCICFARDFRVKSMEMFHKLKLLLTTVCSSCACFNNQMHRFLNYTHAESSNQSPTEFKKESR